MLNDVRTVLLEKALLVSLVQKIAKLVMAKQISAPRVNHLVHSTSSLKTSATKDALLATVASLENVSPVSILAWNAEPKHKFAKPVPKKRAFHSSSVLPASMSVQSASKSITRR